MTAKQVRAATEALFDPPAHFIKDRSAWRRVAQRCRKLSRAARFYAGFLAFHRWSRGTVAWLREEAARWFGVSERTISRWNAELVAAGFLERAVEGLPGRQQVFELTYPQVGKGDTDITPSGSTGPVAVPQFDSTPTGTAHNLASRLIRRTTARRPARSAPALT